MTVKMDFRDLHICDDWCLVQPCGVGQPPTPWCERFESHIIYVADCWIWDSALSKKDCDRNRLNFSTRVNGLYERVGRNAVDACRWIYERTIGPIPEGLELDHFECEDWRCVMPLHLEPVTPYENQQRYEATRASWTLRDSQGKFAGRREDA